MCIDVAFVSNAQEWELPAAGANTVPLLQDCDRLRKEASGSVNVAVDAAPGIDLAAIMENMRKQYEEMAEKNRQEAKEHFEKQVKSTA